MKESEKQLKQEHLSKTISSLKNQNLKFKTLNIYDQILMFAYNTIDKMCYNIELTSNQDIIKIPLNYSNFVDNNGNFIE